MAGTSAIPRMSPISSIPSVPGSIRSSSTRWGCSPPAGRRSQSARSPPWRARPGRTARLRVVVHRENARPLPLRPLPAGGELGNAGCGIPGHRNREGEPRPPDPARRSRPIYGPRGAPLSPFAGGEAQARPRDVPSPVFAVDAGEPPKQVRQPLGGYPSALGMGGAGLLQLTQRPRDRRLCCRSLWNARLSSRFLVGYLAARVEGVHFTQRQGGALAL